MCIPDQEHDHARGDVEMQALGEDQNTKNTARKDQDLKKMLKKLDQHLHRLAKQAFVLANLYYFFQGAILTAVSQVSSPKCHQSHFFYILSIVPFLLNGVPLIYTLCKYVKTKNECDTYKLLRELRRVAGYDHGSAGPIRDSYREIIRYACVVVATIFIIGFNVTMLYSCHTLLCQNSDPKVNDCFRLCDSGNKCLNICAHW